MADKISGPRKQRTRQHVIADLSVHHVEGFILEAGYTAERFGSDYGYDLRVTTFDKMGYVEPGSIYIQLKATEILARSGHDYVYDLDIRDFNLWLQEKMPVILILFEASRRRAYWVGVQNFFEAEAARWPKKGAKTVRIRVPTRQRLNKRAIVSMSAMKRAAIQHEDGTQS